jgi:hypothetical protein
MAATGYKCLSCGSTPEPTDGAAEETSAEPDWHAFYTDSQTKLYHEQEVAASLRRALREIIPFFASRSGWDEARKYESLIESVLKRQEGKS